MNNCPFPDTNCIICGEKDVFNRSICGKCAGSGIKIVEKYYDGTLKFDDISDIIKGKREKHDIGYKKS